MTDCPGTSQIFYYDFECKSWLQGIVACRRCAIAKRVKSGRKKVPEQKQFKVPQQNLPVHNSRRRIELYFTDDEEQMVDPFGYMRNAFQRHETFDFDTLFNAVVSSVTPEPDKFRHPSSSEMVEIDQALEQCLSLLCQGVISTHDNQNKPFSCKICHRRFNLQSEAENHKYTHMSLEALSFHNIYHNQCFICHQRFYSYCQFIRHTRMHRGSLFQCPLCLQKCSHPHVLASHFFVHFDPEQKLKDKEENMFKKCYFCHQLFRDFSHLKDHLRCHTEEKPFNCPACFTSFAHYKTMVQHLKIHSKIPSVRRAYKCNICDKSFTQRGSLGNHKRRHQHSFPVPTPYNCDECQDKKSFPNKSRFVRHMKTVHGVKIEGKGRVCKNERNQICPGCGKGFTRRHDLYRHLNQVCKKSQIIKKM